MGKILHGIIIFPIWLILTITFLVLFFPALLLGLIPGIPKKLLNIVALPSFPIQSAIFWLISSGREKLAFHEGKLTISRPGVPLLTIPADSITNLEEVFDPPFNRLRIHLNDKSEIYLNPFAEIDEVWKWAIEHYVSVSRLPQEPLTPKNS